MPLRALLDSCFNLVIERLLISGFTMPTSTSLRLLLFQSRYRAASHFRFVKTLGDVALLR